MSGSAGSSTWFGTPGYELDQGLKFDSVRKGHLSRNNSTDGDRQKFTWSAWIKLGKLGTNRVPFGAFESSNRDEIRINSDDKFQVFLADAGDANLITNRLFRDTSAWYHFVVAVDTTLGTANNRIRIYVNGVEETSFGTRANPDQNYNMDFTADCVHKVGIEGDGVSLPFDGYMAELNFVDGLALIPQHFGTTGEYGEWKPIQYGGAYGTNGFHLPFKNDYTVQGFSTVISRGNATAKYIGGVGFQPDMVWNATRTTQQNKVIYDSVRGVTNELRTNSDTNQRTADGVTAFKADGFLRGSSNECNENNITYVDWCWDMGGSNANNTTGGIDSVVRANTGYGQSIVTYTGTGSAASVGHGLGIAPKCIFVKNYNTDSRDWATLHMSQYGGGEGHKAIMRLNSDAAYSRTNQAQYWNSTAPTTSVFTVGTHNTTNEDGKLYVAYCWGDVAGYSKFHHYFGNGQATGNTTNVGFRPAWLLIKKTTTTEDWIVYDAVRDEGSTFGKFMEINKNTAELEGDVAETVTTFAITDTGFTPATDDGRSNGNGGTYLYMAFADTRDFAFFLDQSGGNNDFEPNNLTESDIVLDNPTNKFCTWQREAGFGVRTLTEGNLRYNPAGGTGHLFGSIGVSTGKWYFETCRLVIGSGYHTMIANDTWNIAGHNPASAGSYSLYAGTYFYSGEGNVDLGIGAGSVNDIIQIAYDLDDNKIWFGKNGTWYNSGNPSNGTNRTGVMTGQVNRNVRPATDHGNSSYAGLNHQNYGQDSSFGGMLESQGHADSNGKGDFYYAPPTDFLALCTDNIPDPAVVPARHFKALTYTGTGTGQVISGVGFKPDFLWAKRRDNDYGHVLLDIARGFGSAGNDNRLESSAPDVANESPYVASLNADGYVTENAQQSLNIANGTYVGWHWKAGAGNTAVSESGNNPGGTHNANQAAGFSIVKYVGTGANGTVTHGLGAAPELILIKNIGVNDEWNVYYGDNTDYLVLDDTDATADSATRWNDTSPSSTVFTVSTDHSVNADGEKYIAYCFRSIEGHSKLGQYEGNNNANGTFVNTGFRPSLVVVKDIDSTGEWRLQSSKMTTFNNDDINVLVWNASTAEYSDDRDDLDLDFLSNGFKHRSTYSQVNAARTYVYFAFAESPFKHTNAK